MGGGSLTTPILILLFGVSPATAVGTDLLFAAPTKSLGSIVHGFNRTGNARRAAAGDRQRNRDATRPRHLSFPTDAGGARQVITAILALALLLTAGF